MSNASIVHKHISEQFALQSLKWGYQSLPSKDILLNKEVTPFFTFSPMLNVLDIFLNGQEETPRSISQLCVRSMGKVKISHNPIVTNFQKLFALYNFQPERLDHYVGFVHDFLIESLGLVKERFYWQIASDNESMMRIVRAHGFTNIISSVKEQLICKIPELTQEAIYVKILYHYNGGLIPITNLVLIGQKGEISMLDSAFFYDRLLFILEGVESFFETENYRPVAECLDKLYPNLPKPDLRVLGSSLRLATALMLTGLQPGPKKAEYVLRKLIREISTILMQHELEPTNFHWEKMSSAMLKSLYEYEPDLFRGEIIEQDQMVKVFQNEFISFAKNVGAQTKRLVKTLKSRARLEVCFEEIKDLHGTYGIPVELIEKMCKQYGFSCEEDPEVVGYKSKQLPYPFPECRNPNFDPIAWFKQSRFTVS
ncbi:alanine--tRNA ligase-related protein [Tumebacillus lipolyticus]|uniref:Alanine--tRNA ligase-related protein n=1 Tax=Tumebacillus lipolyticus TaxID=1280370 RepID=A0ABW4ZZN9_9BACL